MKLALLALGLVAACRASADDYPLGPGGSGGGRGNGVDAGLGDSGADADGDAGVQITGRVCAITDLRTPTACGTANVSGLTVSIGTTRTATPNARGDFTINAPLGPFVWRVSGNNFNTSIVPVSGDNTLPVISDQLYMEMLAANHVVRPAEELTSAVLRVVQGGTIPAVSVLATSNPATADLPLYDDDDIFIWRSDNLGTGSSGSVWLPDLPIVSGGTGAVTVTLKPPQGATVSTVVPLVDQAITFVTVEL
ncbi:MAG TPA: hypothetical protein VLM79_35800 [Kofleriaceae bacterium]|nr:hypothetical protein [Kofleriaceae bacterium]